ncbi:phosphatase PAP2 family protein [Methylocapsa sp. S129]|uniref:phosphatase PAP2 family protein n=1 Tax=Methylocapsa sp. S129 TaxID=1641869 RepID=UPI00131B8CD7|nr:phosphatase PAP2 family protein [Methylocapsa sp. S129]
MRIVLLGLVALTLATSAVFALWPEIDLEVARAFYGDGGFIGHTSWERAARAFFNITPFVVLAAFAILYGLRRFGAAVPYAPSGRALAFLIATMAIGPGLVVNLGLKDHAHRPRPIQTREFGGPFEFRPWYRFDGECRRNCSFVSGEGSEAFWMVAPASLAPPPFRALAIAGALAFGALTGLLRMAFGGHYLSDVLLAALLTLIIVQGARMLLFPNRDPS